MWIFIVYYKYGETYRYYDKRLYILVKQNGYYRSLGFKIFMSDRKIISYGILIKRYFNYGRLFHVSQMPEDKVTNKKNKVDFMFTNKILISEYEKVAYSRRLSIRRKTMEKLNKDIISLINEFTKDARY